VKGSLLRPEKAGPGKGGYGNGKGNGNGTKANGTIFSLVLQHDLPAKKSAMRGNAAAPRRSIKLTGEEALQKKGGSRKRKAFPDSSGNVPTQLFGLVRCVRKRKRRGRIE